MDFTLKGWQSEVVNIIEQYDELRDSHASQGVSNYDLNRKLGVTIALPSGAGHTFLATYLAKTYPTFLVYTSTKHYHEIIEQLDSEFIENGNQSSTTASMHEIFYAMNKPGIHQPCQELLDLRDRIASKKVIVVDKAEQVPPTVKDFLYNSASGIVIMLGR
jgi:hypothetical protein